MTGIALSTTSWAFAKRSAGLAFMVAILAIAFPSTSRSQSAPPPDMLNPLEITEPDPLLPELVVDRPLSPQERRVLETALNELRLQAEASIAEGDVSGAFEIWVRELRLRRALGVRQEVEALSRVGEVAWRENQRIEVRFITLRLQEIEQEVLAQTPTDYDLLMTIAQAYQRVRAQELALAAYERLLVRADEQQDIATMRMILSAMGELHLAWFDFPNAALVYQELRTLAQQQRDFQGEVDALQQLAYVYRQDGQHELAIITMDELVEIYRDRAELAPITELKLSIGDSYLAIDRPDLAATNYQEAFAIARTNQQFGYASDALQRLAQLYRDLNQLNDAILVYELLIDVEEQSYSSYGMMDAYDQLGQIYQEQGATNRAISAFREGLRLARELDFRQDYFQSQIESLQTPAN